MVRPSHNDIRTSSVGAILSKFHWNLEFLTAPMTENSDVTGAMSIEQGIATPLNYRCTSVTMPARTMNKMEVTVRGHKFYQHGSHSYSGDMTLTFFETQDNAVYRRFQPWWEAHWKSIQGTQYLPQEIQCKIGLQLLGKNDEAIRIYTLYGCFLGGWTTGIDTLEDGSSATVVSPSATISYDYYTEENINQDQMPRDGSY